MSAPYRQSYGGVSPYGVISSPAPSLQVAEMQKERDELQKALMALTEAMRKVEAKNQRLERDNNMLRSRPGDEAGRSSLADECARLRSELERTREMLRDREKESRKLEMSLQEVERKRDELKLQVDLLTKREARRENEGVGEGEGGSQKENFKLKLQLDATREEAKKAHLEINRLKAQLKERATAPNLYQSLTSTPTAHSVLAQIESVRKDVDRQERLPPSPPLLRGIGNPDQNLPRSLDFGNTPVKFKEASLVDTGTQTMPLSQMQMYDVSANEQGVPGLQDMSRAGSQDSNGLDSNHQVVRSLLDPPHLGSLDAGDTYDVNRQLLNRPRSRRASRTASDASTTGAWGILWPSMEDLIPGTWPVSRRLEHPLQEHVPQTPTGSLDQARAQVRAAEVEVRKYQEMEARARRGSVAKRNSMIAGDSIDVIVVAGLHLPKVNAVFGSIDPYFVLEVGTERQKTGLAKQKTTKKKNNTNPEFNERFSFEIMDPNAFLHVTLKDKEKIGHNRVVGECAIAFVQISSADKSGLDTMLQLCKPGTKFPLHGPDGRPSVVHLKLSHSSSRPAPPKGDDALKDVLARKKVAEDNLKRARATLDNMTYGKDTDMYTDVQTGATKSIVRVVHPTATAFQPFQWTVKVLRAGHLPQMDTAGKADPYVMLDMSGQNGKTETIRNTLNPFWSNAEFKFDVSEETDELVLTVMDWDRYSKDELIGEVRIKAVEYARRPHSGAFTLSRPGGHKIIVGRDGVPATLTLSFSTSLVSLQEGGGGGRGTDPRQPVTVCVRMDAVYDDMLGSAEQRELVAQQIESDLARSLGVPAKRIKVLNLEQGSVIADINLLPDDVDPRAPVPMQLASRMIEMVEQGSSVLGSGTGAGLVACTVCDRKWQLEAENGYLLRMYEVFKGRLEALEKVKKMKKSEGANRAMKRWANMAVYNAFFAWQVFVDTQALLKEKDGEHKKELNAVLAKVEEDKKQEQAVYEQKKKELEERLDKTRQIEASLGESIANKLTAAQAEEKRRAEEQLAELERAHKDQLASFEARAQQEADRAKKEGLEHESRAKEAAERQFNLERQLRMQLAQLKVSGGGPVLRVKVHKGVNLPKVDSMGWIDAYLVMKVGDEIHKTQIQKKNRNPEWNEEHAFSLVDMSGYLDVTLYDWEMMRTDQAVGVLRVKIEDALNGVLYGPFPLEQEFGGALLWDGAPSLLHATIKFEEGSNAEAQRLQKEIDAAKAIKEREEEEARVSQADAARALRQMSGSDQRTASVEARNLHPPYKLEVLVQGCRDLPKMDTFGKCDAYVVIKTGSQEKKTNRVDSNYDPNFNEMYKFDVKDSSASLAVSVFDYDRGDKDDLVGIVRIPLGKMTAGVPVESSYRLLDKKGNPVMGHSKKETRLLLKLTAFPLDLALQSGGVRGAGDAEGFAAFGLRVKVKEGSHMPKCDAFGKCDAYCIVSIGGQRQQTKPCKVTYSPEWNEEFSFQVMEPVSELVVNVFDWDLVGKDDFVGVVHVPLDEITGKDEEYPLLLENSDACIGHDGSPATITLQCSKYDLAEEAAAAAVGPEEMEGGGEPMAVPFDLVVGVKNCRSLPKTDMLGKIDAYCVISVAGQEQRTDKVKNTYDPDFNETMQMRVTSTSQSMTVKIYDWDRLGKDTHVGTVQLAVGKVPSGGRAKRYPIIDPRGAPLKGHDGQLSTILLSMTPKEIPPEASGGMFAGDNALPRCIRARVVKVNHLPKMDTMGTCDPFVQVVATNPPQRFVTKTHKRTYDAVWDDAEFDIKLASGSEELVFRVMDWDLVGEDELVGTVNVPAQDIAREKTSKILTVLAATGTPVVGRDGQQTTLTVEFEEAPVAEIVAFGDEPKVNGIVQVLIESAKGLPKMDTFTHKADPFAILAVGDQEHKTQVKKKTLRPEWNESASLACTAGQSELLVRLFDWNATSKNEFMGEVRIPIHAEGCGATDYMLEGDISPGRPCQGSVRLSYTFTPGGEGEVADGGARGVREELGERIRLAVTVEAAVSLPKTDMMSKCDPYVQVTVGVETRKTEHKTSVYNAEWASGDATFHFSAASTDVVDVSVWDWNRTSKNELIGTVKIPLTIIRAGTPNKGEYAILDSAGQPVLGHDKKPTKVRLSLVGTPEENDQADGAGYDVTVKIEKCEHMPKMDMLGKCDPLVTIKLGVCEKATKHLSNCYDGVWDNEEFMLGTKTLGDELLITLWDWDAGSSNDFIGDARLKLSEFAVGGGRFERRVEVKDKSGKIVKGKDGSNTAVYLSVGVAVHVESRGEKAFAIITKGVDVDQLCADLLNKPWTLKVLVISGERLPKTDRLGLCDPFVTLTIEGPTTSKDSKGLSQQTEVKYKDLSPVWNKKLSLGPMELDVSKAFLNVALMDKDAFSSETVGVLKIPLGVVLAGLDKEWPPLKLETKKGAEPLKDAQGFDTLLRLAFSADLPNKTDRAVVLDPYSQAKAELMAGIDDLQARVREFKVKEESARQWLSNSDAEVDDLWGRCDQLMLQIDMRVELDKKAAQKRDLKDRVEDLKNELKVACGEAFSVSQAQIVIGIGVTIVQMVLLKLMMFGS